MDLIICFKNIGGVISQIYGTLINIVIGIGTGLISSYIISRYYKAKDIKRETNEYISSLKKHIVRICRYLIKIDINKADMEMVNGYMNDLIEELTDVPLGSSEYRLNEFYKDCINRYKTQKMQIDKHISEYNRCVYVLPLLKRMKYNNTDVINTEKQLQNSIIQISCYMTDWLKLRNDMREYENK